MRSRMGRSRQHFGRKDSRTTIMPLVKYQAICTYRFVCPSSIEVHAMSPRRPALQMLQIFSPSSCRSMLGTPCLTGNLRPVSGQTSSPSTRCTLSMAAYKAKKISVTEGAEALGKRECRDSAWHTFQHLAFFSKRSNHLQDAPTPPRRVRACTTNVAHQLGWTPSRDAIEVLISGSLSTQ